MNLSIEPEELNKCAIKNAEFVIDDGSILEEVSASSAPKCQAACAAAEGCEAWVANTNKKECTLYENVEGKIEDINDDSDFLSGFMECESDSKRSQLFHRSKLMCVGNFQRFQRNVRSKNWSWRASPQPRWRSFLPLRLQPARTSAQILTIATTSPLILRRRLAAFSRPLMGSRRMRMLWQEPLVVRVSHFQCSTWQSSPVREIAGAEDPCKLKGYQVEGKKRIVTVKTDDSNVCQLLCNIKDDCTVWSSNEADKECNLYSGVVKKVKANNDFDSGASECGTDKSCEFKKTGIQTEEVIDTVNKTEAVNEYWSVFEVLYHSR